MGKQAPEQAKDPKSPKAENDNEVAEKHQQQQNVASIQAPKRKIIKKMLPRSTGTLKSKQDSSMKNWVPRKIDEQKREVQPKPKISNQSITDSFLSSLSKPHNETTNNTKKYRFDDDVDDDLQTKPKLPFNRLPKAFTSQSLQQQQEPELQAIADLEKKGVQEKLKEIEEISADQLEPEPEIVIMRGHEKKQVKVREINIGRVIDKEWRETSSRTRDQKNINLKQFWTESGLPTIDGKLSAQEIQKYMDIEDQISKRQLEKKKMKSRYGW